MPVRTTGARRCRLTRWDTSRGIKRSGAAAADSSGGTAIVRLPQHIDLVGNHLAIRRIGRGKVLNHALACKEVRLTQMPRNVVGQALSLRRRQDLAKEVTRLRKVILTARLDAVHLPRRCIRVPFASNARLRSIKAVGVVEPAPLAVICMGPSRW